MKSKIRIQLFDKEGKLESDRLVDQYTEFNMGPKDKHEGHIRVEFNLQNQQEVQGAIVYLEQLTGLTPVKILKQRGRKPMGAPKPDVLEDSRTKILEELKNKKFTDQEKMINFLRNDCNFTLLSEQHMAEMGIELNLKRVHKDKGYYFFMRCLRLAKDPINDKFDPTLSIGMKILEPSEKVIIYRHRNYEEKLMVPVPDKKFIFKSQAILRFPKFMSEDERLKFRKENRELLANSDKKKSKFYRRWEPDVKIPKALQTTND
tara:strand:+ start:927 stop:1709 length:783 start_codon:yes stop_codon:yes gene_type:complete